MFPAGSVVPAMDYTVPARWRASTTPIQFVSAYDSIADFPDRPDNLFALASSIVGLATGHTWRWRSPTRAWVPPQNVRTTVNSRGATTTTYLIPEQHLPLVLPFVPGFDEGTLQPARRDPAAPGERGLFAQRRSRDRSRSQVDPVHGFDPLQITAPINEATFGGGGDAVSG